VPETGRIWLSALMLLSLKRRVSQSAILQRSSGRPLLFGQRQIGRLDILKKLIQLFKGIRVQ